MRKYALCVGGTSGIGNALAKNFGKAEINVHVIGRNEDAGKALVKTLKLIHPKGDHSYVPCDAFLMKNIRKSCDVLKHKIPYLNYCVFTQGIVSMNKRMETTEGIDRKMALHYYGRAQYVEALIPLLKDGFNISKDAKVVSVLSAGEHQAYLQRADLMLRNNYTVSDVANATGFYTDLMWDYYSRIPDNEGIGFIHMHPGNVHTDWGKDLGFIHRMLARIIQAGGITPEKCADNLCKSLFNDVITQRGGFYIINKNGELGNTTAAHGPGWREEVYKHTMEVLASTIPKLEI